MADFVLGGNYPVDIRLGSVDVLNVAFGSTIVWPRTPTPTPTTSPSSIISTPTPTITPSITPSLSISMSLTPSITPSITPSRSISMSITPSITPSRSISMSVTPSRTVSRTATPTRPAGSPSRTPSITPSRSISSTPSITPSRPAASPSITPSKTPTPSASASSGTIYYVKNGGNNGADGLSDANAWNTIAYVNGKTFTAGTQILFKCGSTWAETLVVPSSGSAGSPIIFGEYSTGANPLIDVSNAQSSCITLTSKSYVTIDGIDCKNATAYGIASPSSPGTNITIKNLTISYIGTTNTDLQHAIFQQGGYLTVDNVTITQISHCGIMFGGGHNVITDNNVSYTNLYYTGWGAGINGAGDSDVVSGNTIDNCGGVGQVGLTHGIYVDPTNGDIHHNTITNSTRGSGIKCIGGGDIHHNYCSGSNNSGIETGTNGKTSGGPFTCDVYYNLLTGNREGLSSGNFGSVAYSLNIFNNVFYYNNSTRQDTYYSELSLVNNIPTALVIKNNIIFGYGRYTYASNVVQTNATINNNCVYQASGSLIYYNGARTWAYWQGLGFDTNGKNVNPNMVNPPTDFSLQAGSQCENAGLNVSLTTDYAGNAVGSPPEIGAYEM